MGLRVAFRAGLRFRRLSDARFHFLLGKIRQDEPSLAIESIADSTSEFFDIELTIARLCFVTIEKNA